MAIHLPAPEHTPGSGPWYVAAVEVLIKLLKEIGVGGTIIVFACAWMAYTTIEAGKFVAPLMLRMATAIEQSAATSAENGRKLDRATEEIRQQHERTRELVREAKDAAARAEIAAMRERR